MASSFPGTMNPVAVVSPATATPELDYSAIYTEHSHRIYSLAFWMTDNEILAEELASNTFLRVFSRSGVPGTHQVDQAFLTEVRESFAIGTLTLTVVAAPSAENMRASIKRVHLERAVVQLPATEKLIFLFHDVEGYSHERIAILLGINEEESQYGLHQARLRIREVVSALV